MMSKEIKTAVINWVVEGNIECPHCEHEMDFTDQDEWYEVCEIGENKVLSRPYFMTCPECKKEFAITESTY